MRRSFIVSGALVALVGCSSTPSTTPTGVAGTKPAVMVSVIASSPEGRRTYVGAFSDVPTGAVSTNAMVEFGDAYFYAFDGSIFVWNREQAAITRYAVTDDLRLLKGDTVSFASFGLKYDGELTFISPTRAYLMIAGQNVVVVWDPSTMSVGHIFPANLPTRPNLDTFPIQIGVSGGNVYWSIFSDNSDAGTVYPKNVVAFAPANVDGPVTLIEDDRCIPALGGYIVGNGDIYLAGGADADAIAAYKPTAGYPPSCLVRIRAGQSTFDGTYYFDLWKATGSKAIAGDWLIDDSSFLARAWNPEVPLPAVIDDFWSGSRFVSKRIDFATGTATDFSGLPEGGFSSNIQDRVDGATYLSIPAADGSADVAYKLTSAGLTQAFSIPGGGYWGMRRVR